MQVLLQLKIQFFIATEIFHRISKLASQFFLLSVGVVNHSDANAYKLVSVTALQYNCTIKKSKEIPGRQRHFFHQREAQLVQLLQEG